MCGISGIVNTGSVTREDVLRMTGLLKHRGPDEGGIYVERGIGLGHRRLSIIDLHTGSQPLSNEDGTIWVVFNGEIYNYQSLRADLLNRGHRFKTWTDTEVIAHLYEECGEKCVQHLRGMFAFALWDGKCRHLFAARDRLGQKPFFYMCRPGAFAFASEIKALLQIDSSLNEPDLESLDQYLTLRIIAPPRTMFRAIRKLPPAHYLTFNADTGLRIERYWQPAYEPKLVGSDRELIAELETRLIECVKLHMVSDVPVGAFLSGGLDSTLIVALLMKHISSEPIQTFTVGLPYMSYDEAPYARMVAERYGTCHIEESIVPSLVQTLPQVVWHLDEPSDPLAVCTYLIAKMARKHVKVVLGGDGGDELFGGYDRYYGNLAAGYYRWLPTWLRRAVISPLLRRVPDGRWYKSLAHQWKWLHELSFLEGGSRYARSLSYFYFDRALRSQLYGPAMRREADRFDPELPVREAFQHACASEMVDRMLSADSQIRLPDHSVMILDRMTMAHGLEARSPFMDHELVEFAARLPVRLKVRGRALRYAQKQLAKRYLPEPLLARPKQGFSSALPYMLQDEYRLLVDTFLRESHLASGGLLDQQVITRLCQAYHSTKADHGNRLWLLLNGELWYRLFMEGSSVEELSETILRNMQPTSGGRAAKA